MKTQLWLLPLLLAATVFAYLPGLSGPFVFDDAVHISHNDQVHITDLSPASLRQAWHSSLAEGVGSRPLAMLTFGINHALGGLDTTYYKAANLAIHLLTGLLLFALARQLTRVLSDGRDTRLDTADSPWPALLVTALWLLHPINLTPVLYVVQRMTSLSTLFVIAGLWCHVSGRRRMAAGDGRGLWLALAGLPLAGIGGLAKESAALYPLLVLVLEWTLLRRLAAPRRALLITIVAWLPIALGAIYFFTHLGMIGYEGRSFTLGERLLSEARILWLYLRMLLLPDPTLLGFYHDDIALSHGLLDPWTTLPAVLGWLLLVPAALLGARRWPVASFGLLFFLAGHALESTILPLELVFEHRNYLPAVGPLFALAWWLSGRTLPNLRRLLAPAALLILLLLAAITHLRAMDWSDTYQLLFNEVRHHPDSPRANFRTAQLLMDQVGKGDGGRKTYLAARYHLSKVLEMAPDNLDARFGQLFLELFVGQDPPMALLDDLTRQLHSGPVDPTKLSIGQFAFLVRWQLGGGHHLADARALAILQAPLDNPRANYQMRAAVLSALRAYHDRVLHDPQAALPYARRAVETWPQRWHYHYRLVQLLLHLDRMEEAQAAFDAALRWPSAALNPEQRDELADALQQRVATPSTHHD